MEYIDTRFRGGEHSGGGMVVAPYVSYYLLEDYCLMLSKTCQVCCTNTYSECRTIIVNFMKGKRTCLEL